MTANLWRGWQDHRKHTQFRGQLRVARRVQISLPKPARGGSTKISSGFSCTFVWLRKKSRVLERTTRCGRPSKFFFRSSAEDPSDSTAVTFSKSNARGEQSGSGVEVPRQPARPPLDRQLKQWSEQKAVDLEEAAQAYLVRDSTDLVGERALSPVSASSRVQRR